MVPTFLQALKVVVEAIAAAVLEHFSKSRKPDPDKHQ